ncbi:MAG: copper oxidase [Candidatus Methanoperedens sp.]|nr:copper oxidase [Candidatus Methanoperedens sp.]
MKNLKETEVIDSVDMEKNALIRMDRRTFVKIAGGVAGAIAFGGLSGKLIQQASAAAAGTPNITKFIDPLLSSIPKLQPVANPSYPDADYYEIEMKPGRFQFSSQLPVTAAVGTNTTWGYGGRDLIDTTKPLVFLGYLGPTIEAQNGKIVVVKFINNLPPTQAAHPLAASIDPTVPDPTMYKSPDGTPLPGGRAVPHLHGGFTAPQFDGHPHAWFTSDGKQGSHYGTLSGAAGNEAIFVYSNQQPAANLWYHDHAMGITRLNVYAGLAGLYFVRDTNDTGIPGTGLNLPAGPYEVPLVIQDKQFNANGTLFYPTAGITAVHPVWVPEFFGDTPVVNGTAYPFFNVEPRRYRFRIVNGSQARFYNLWFDNGVAPIQFYLIGMEQSLLPAPVPMTKLLIAPGERADIIVDFTGLQNQVFTLKNNAKAPYPGGRGGAINQIMQFRVNVPLAGPDTTTPAASLVLPPVPRLVPTAGAPLREIVMKEDLDPVTGLPIDMKLNGRWFDDRPIDETPKQNDIEIWQFINLTVDAHPMHSHLVKFQVYNRQPFNAKAYTTAWLAYQAGTGTKPVLANYLTKGPAVPPLPEEMGWKDTAKAYPGEILRVIAQYELPPADINIPGSNTVLPAEYVYHCHILEHEENEMMRPFQVV